MNEGKLFFDTNVLLYLLSGGAKADKAEDLLRDGGTISVQVLNEFASVAYRKLKMAWPEIRDILSTLRAVCEVVDITEEIHESGLAIAEQYGFSFYDSLILAAAIKSECQTVFSEDMQGGQKLRGLRIQNPF